MFPLYTSICHTPTSCSSCHLILYSSETALYEHRTRDRETVIYLAEYQVSHIARSYQETRLKSLLHDMMCHN